jgi:hypothetical protein
MGEIESSVSAVICEIDCFPNVKTKAPGAIEDTQGTKTPPSI